MTKTQENRLLLYLGYLTAFLLAGHSAVNSLNHDTAIFIRAGLREVFDQTIYRDYYVPQGVVAGWIAGLAIRITPTIGWAIILLSAITNCVAAFLVAEIVQQTTQSRFYQCLSAWLTAICFIPIMGAFYNDHLAYLWILIGIYWLTHPSTPTSVGFLVASVLAAVSFHTKQPVGLMGMATFFSYALFFKTPSSRLKNCAISLSGFLIGNALFWGNYWLEGNWSNYFRYSIEYPYYFATRIKSADSPLFWVLFPWSIAPSEWVNHLSLGQASFFVFSLFCYAAIAWIAVSWIRRQTSHPIFGAIWLLTLSTLWCSSLLGRLYAQLFFGGGGVCALALYAWENYQPRFKALRRPICVGLLGVAGIIGGKFIFQRMNHPNFPGVGQLAPLNVAKHQHLIDANEIALFLKDKPGNYALFSEDGYLIPLTLGRPPLSAPVYHEAGLTFPYYRKEAIPAWEAQMLDQLKGKDIQYVILPHGWKQSEKDYPRLSEHFALLFRRVYIRLNQDVRERRIHPLKPRPPQRLATQKVY